MVVCFAAVVLLTTPRRAGSTGSGSAAAEIPRFADVRAIVNARCLACHSAYPSDSIYTIAPTGIVFDTPDQIAAMAARIRERAVIQRTMPLNNSTGMTDAERALVGRWVDAGAPRP